MRHIVFVRSGIEEGHRRLAEQRLRLRQGSSPFHDMSRLVAHAGTFTKLAGSEAVAGLHVFYTSLPKTGRVRCIGPGADLVRLHLVAERPARARPEPGSKI